MAIRDSYDDRELLRLSRQDGQAFGEFYARHERRLLGYLVRHTRSGELAADLCAEIFAVALQACRDDRPIPETPVAWLFGIANHKLADGVRRARIDDRARRALEMRAVELTHGQVSAIERLCDEAEADSLLRGLAAEQRAAVLARVVEGREYREIAADLRCSESVVRKRVSRGIAALRVHLEEAR